MKRWYILGLIISMTMIGTAQAVEIRVPDQVSTIQKAIENATTGDSIVVAPGTYTGPIDFIGKDIILTSQDPLNSDIVNSTIIEKPRINRGGNRKTSVVVFQSGETLAAQLLGFTIKDGFGTRSEMFDEGDQQAYMGGGIYCINASPTISHNVIKNNEGASDFGISMEVSYGGGIGCLNSRAIISYNQIYSNRAAFGGGIIAFEGQVTLANNLIHNNHAMLGGGIVILPSGSVLNNTICFNSADLYAGNGYLVSDPETQDLAQALNVHSNIFSHASQGGGLLIAGSPLIPWFTYNNIWDNEPHNFVVPQEDGSLAPDMFERIGSLGNISLDPMFVDAENNDYHLLETSPCINTGDPDFESLHIDRDLDGDDRVLYQRIDIGADEYPGCTRPVAFAGPDQYQQLGPSVTLDGSGSLFCDNSKEQLYLWDQLYGPAAALNDPFATQPVFTPTHEGIYGFELIIYDGQYVSQPDIVEIHIGNRLPIAQGGEDQTVTVPTYVHLDASTSWDPDPNTVLTYQWSQVEGPEIQIDDSRSAVTGFHCTTAGIYILQVIVNDGRDNSLPDQVIINAERGPSGRR